MENNNTINVRIIYPADPVGNIPGGIDTCIKDLIRWSPNDIAFSVIGATTDRVKRPVYKWTKCVLGKRTFQFFPVITIDHPGRQSKIPATLRYLVRLVLNRPGSHCDIIQFHRIEPTLIYLKSEIPKVTFIHQDMEVLHNKSSDIRWSYTPRLYFKLEEFLFKQYDFVYIVHETAVKAYRLRYSRMASKINFLPTWMNPEIFYPISQEEKKRLQSDYRQRYHIKSIGRILVWIGRLDSQKNPERLIESFSIVAREFSDIHLVVIGDGVLRHQVERSVEKYSLTERVTFTGLLPNEGIGDWLRVSDMLVLSSDYEGMPRCVVEALGCGTPVATTDVGEVRRIVHSGVNGKIAKERTTVSLAEAIVQCLNNIEIYRGTPCLEATSAYVPENILRPVYDTYRRLAVTNPRVN
jgi:glycosyltransferase involved in cell wall biosynthesis